MHLWYFKNVAEMQNVSKASEKLRVAQPAVSKTVRLLEEELGFRLFDRSGNRIVLNENGAIFLKYVNTIFGALHDARQELLDSSGEDGSAEETSMSIAIYSASKMMPLLLHGFKEQYPDMPLSLVIHNGRDAAVQDHDIMIFQDSEDLSETGLRKLLEEEVYLAIPVSHPLAERESVDLAELSDSEFIALSSDYDFRAASEQVCRKAGFEPKIALECNDPGTVREFVNLGFGFAFMPKFTWGEVQDPGIRLVPIVNPKFYRKIYIAYRKDRYVSHSAKLFKNYAVEFFSNIDRYFPID